MKLPFHLPAPSVVMATAFLLCQWSPADTVVNFGTVTQIAGVADVDLTGAINYAINFSNNDPVLTLSGIDFTPDRTPPAGASFLGPNNVTPWATKPEFGDTPDDDILEQIFEDIRWANSGVPGQFLEAHLPVTSGQTYKLQVLFYGNQTEDRKWDIEVEGALAVDEITSLGVRVGGITPDYLPNAGLVYSTNVIATDNMLDLRFVGNVAGTPNEGGDRNALWQGLILSQADSDSDLLPDTWETLHFGNLSQNATGDPDGEGLTNLAELRANTKPNDPDSDDDTLEDDVETNTGIFVSVSDTGTSPLQADSDSDGLTDPVEITTHHTNPSRADSDLDALNDGAEITATTDPLDFDSDNDCYVDGLEVAEGSNPKSAASFPLTGTQAIQVLGGDAAEDCLDLDVAGGSQFAYAVKIGTAPPPPDPIRGVTFTDDQNTPGFTISAQNEIAAWFTADFGSSPNDDALEQVFSSIRWSGAPAFVTLTMANLEVGKPYKMQLLFAEACCARGFDVLVNDTLVLNDFGPFVMQEGMTATNVRGAAVVHSFVATSTTLKVVLDGNTAAFPDKNATVSGVTLEKLNPGDTDGDGLPDDWERQFFGNTTSQGATGDPDADGLNNQGELLAGSTPTDADSDDDTLNDGVEVATHHTNPNVADTDGDTLTDPAEVNTHLTDPTKRDTDSDCLFDAEEVNTFQTNPKDPDSDDDAVGDAYEVLVSRTDAKDPTSVPAEVKNGLVCGGDEGEGLDLKGDFVYAFNVGPNGAAGQIQDANFTDDAAPGITVTAVNALPTFASFNFGTSINDINLKKVMDSIRWQPSGSVTVDLTDIVPGARYKLQVLFGEGCCAARGEDIIVEGVTVVHNFITGPAQGGQGNGVRGSVVTYEFTAPDDVLNISCDGPAADDPIITDHNAILSGITLEKLPAITGSFAITQVTKAATSVTINFLGQPTKSYAVDFSPNLAAWTEVTDSTTTTGTGTGTFTDTNAARAGGILGHYRVRDPVVKPTP